MNFNQITTEKSALTEITNPIINSDDGIPSNYENSNDSSSGHSNNNNNDNLFIFYKKSKHNIYYIINYSI